MTPTHFHLITDWVFDAPIQAVWNALAAPEAWPSWWRMVAAVEGLAPGDANGIGALRRITWRTALPYTLTFDICTTRIEPMTLIEGRAEGELTGLGRWTLASSGGRTSVRYDWTVEVTQPWMRLVAPLARPVFAWNHGVVMASGHEGLARKLSGHGRASCP